MAETGRGSGLLADGGWRVLFSVVVVVLVACGCSGEGDDASGEPAPRRDGGDPTTLIGGGLGHQAFQGATRLVVPAAEGDVPDRAARVLAGVSEGPLGARLFVDQRPDDGGLAAWRDVAGQAPEGHQLAYVTEGLLARDGQTRRVGPESFELAARTDLGFAVLVTGGDPEVETLQSEDFEDFGDFVSGAKGDPGDVEVADAGADTVYRAGTLALEREAGVDLSPKSPAHKTPTQAVYDADVETALVPVDEGVLADVLAGELVALAVLGGERCPDLPGVPTTRELGYDVSVPVFGGIAAPAGTPRPVVAELGRAFVEASSSEPFATVLVGTGREPKPLGPQEFDGYVEEATRSVSGER